VVRGKNIDHVQIVPERGDIVRCGKSWPHISQGTKTPRIFVAKEQMVGSNLARDRISSLLRSAQQLDFAASAHVYDMKRYIIECSQIDAHGYHEVLCVDRNRTNTICGSSRTITDFAGFFGPSPEKCMQQPEFVDT
jgi:hypothetical protein